MLESGRLPLDRIITHQLPLEQFEQGLELVADGTRSIKVSLIPSRTGAATAARHDPAPRRTATPADPRRRSP